MAFSINTNIVSLQAQENLRQTSDFQAKTLNRVTSGLRIVQSGDDAAGLAIANGLRSDEAVLTQGVRNANDGLSTLQTIDGGMSNISKLLDRARTLATQSASGAYVGDRGALNNEFQNVMGEINRQAQAVGMDKGGAFAKSLSVFVGGGRGSTDAAQISNGSVGLDLSKATVDAKSLGLDTYRAMSTNNSDLSVNSATSVSKIIANQGTGVTTANFTFAGAGFGNVTAGDTGQIKVSISTTGITDTAGLATAINNAIYNAANPGTETTATKAFKAAGITASVVTDSTGKEQLSFSSASAAFQVHGDQLANAFMGFAADSRVSKVTGEGSTYVQGGSALATITTNLTAVTLDFKDMAGGALAGGTKTLTINGTGGNSVSAQAAVDSINASIGAQDIQAELKDGKLAFYSKTGTEFNVTVSGDTGNALGMIDATNPRAASSAEGSTIALGVTDATDAKIATMSLRILAGDGTTQIGSDVSLASGVTSATNATDFANLASDLNTKLSTATGGKIKAEATTAGVRLYSTDNSVFELKATTSSTVAVASSVLGITSGVSGAYGSASVSAYLSKETEYQGLTSGGVYQSTQEGSSAAYTDYSNQAYDFTKVTGSQQITISAKSADGSIVSDTIKLDSTSGATVSKALDAINNELQKSSDASLKGITAIRDQNGIRFMGTQGFSVQLGTGSVAGATEGLSEVKDGKATQAGVQLDATTQGQSGMADISSQSSASNAVAALSKAVSALGQAQAVVGKGQNQFSYAINLAQSQLTNMAAAESRIRDADLANEAANMTKAQILTQAGVAAMAQANSAPNQILSLLRG